MKPPSLNSRGWGCLIALSVLIVYSGIYHSPWVFDDTDSITENRSIRSLWPLPGPLSPPNTGTTVAGRPIANLSFALDYAISGTSPWSYRATNVAIHIAAALLLFGIVRRTLLAPALRERFGDDALPIAALSALLWAVHPLATESVTYAVQRTESLMGMLFLLTLYGFIRATGEAAATRWRVISVISCLLAAGTKEVAAVAPFVVIVYDRTFVSGSFPEAWRRHRGYYVSLALSWGLLVGLLLTGGGDRGGTYRIDSIAGFSGYWLTQFEAVTQYLLLTIWPNPLVFDYGTFARSFAEALPYMVVVGALVAGTCWALARKPVLGFAGFWFFAILAPTSFMPSQVQTIVEHRTYLPIAALVVLGAIAIHSLAGRRVAAAILLTAGVALGARTIARNADYRDDVVLWSKSVASRPGSVIGLEGLGWAQGRAGNLGEAADTYRRAIALDPKRPRGHFDLGVNLMKLGRNEEALAELKLALSLQSVRDPYQLAAIEDALAIVLLRTGSAAQAVEYDTDAVRLNPGNPGYRQNLADALMSAGRPGEAIPYYQAELDRAPGDSALRTRLGIANLALGREDEAERQFRDAIARDPNYPPAQLWLGNVLAKRGGRAALTEAVGVFQAFLGKDSTSQLAEMAHTNLAATYHLLGDDRSAAAEAQAAELLRQKRP